MNQNSQPPSSDAPERPAGERPWPEQPSQPPQPPQQPPGAYPPGYAPPAQPYPGQGQGYSQQPGYPPPGAAQGRPQGAPPPGYQPQGYPPPGYSQPPGPGGAPPPWNYPPPGPPQGQGYPPPGYSEAPKKSGMPAWAWIIIGFVGLLILSCAGVIAALGYVGNQVSKSFSTIGTGFFESLEPMSVASEFYAYLESNDYDSAHELLSSDLGSKWTSGDLQLKWDALSSSQGTVTPGFPTTHGGYGSNKSSVTLDQELTSSSGKVYIITLTMVKSGDTWVIQDANPGLVPDP
jgi:hypothetical protein